jgi:hypothetical protein
MLTRSPKIFILRILNYHSNVYKGSLSWDTTPSAPLKAYLGTRVRADDKQKRRLNFNGSQSGMSQEREFFGSFQVTYCASLAVSRL